MDIFEAIAASGFIGVKIAVPVLRVTASVFLASAISKDCQSRRNGSNILWGIITFIFPVFFGVIYLAYSRFFTDRKPETQKEKSDAKSAKILFLISVFIYIVTAVVFVVSFIVFVSSSLAEAI